MLALTSCFHDERMGEIRHVRRIPHPGRGVGGNRTRRTNMHFQSAGPATLSALSPSSRESMDPIAGWGKNNTFDFPLVIFSKSSLLITQFVNFTCT